MDISPLISEIERASNLLNKLLFDDKIQPFQISIQIKKKVSIKWQVDIETLVIGVEFLQLEFNDILGVLLHELVHISNYQRGITDVTINQYHNKHFLASANQVGLVVIKHKTQGWGITSTVFPRNIVERAFIKRPLKNAIVRRNKVFQEIKLNEKLLTESRVDLQNRIKNEKPVKTFFLKYECNCAPPHNSIRSGRRPDGPNALNIQCMNCRSKFECVTDLGFDEE